MKKIIKNFVIILIISIMLLFINNIESQAALQANQDTINTKKMNNPNSWMQEVRKMEMPNNALGLNEELNADLTYKGEPNGIDMHMIRNTEYGAVAILSASGYGNPSNEKYINSTTGNNTGVIVSDENPSSHYEIVAGYLYNGTNHSNGWNNVNEIYYDKYTGQTNSAIKGDALVECSNWHEASKNGWFSGSNRWFVRNTQAELFSYISLGIAQTYSYNYDCFCRGVAVCGEGL